MRIPRIYLNQPLTAHQTIPLDGRNAHYLSTVLRMKSGMMITAFDGSGLEYACQLLDLDKKSGNILTADAVNPGTESSLFTTLAIGISRGERMDYVVQKSTELGIHRIQPLFTENCEVRLDEKRAEKRREHWQQIAISACEQSGRVIPPEILTPITLSTWIDLAHEGCCLLLDQAQPAQLNSMERPDTVTLLIGPEGGVSENEKALALSKGFKGLTLGSRTLRTETAPVAALSLCQFLWGS
jgi:16S rRNA (uracil1498-N3)-methyltransferase